MSFPYPASMFSTPIRSRFGRGLIVRAALLLVAVLPWLSLLDSVQAGEPPNPPLRLMTRQTKNRLRRRPSTSVSHTLRGGGRDWVCGTRLRAC